LFLISYSFPISGINNFFPAFLNNFNDYRLKAQKIKDAYYSQFQILAGSMADKYSILKSEAEALLAEIDSLPKGLNTEAKENTLSLIQYADQRCIKDVNIDFDVRDKNTRFTYSEIRSFIELYPQKSADLGIIKAGLIRKEPDKKEANKKGESKTRLFNVKAPSGKMKVSEYKKWLKDELQRLAAADDNDEIEINK